jgi:hypothetical protein
MPESFLAGRVALALAPPAFHLGYLDELAVDAAPTQFFAMSESFLGRSIALETLRLGLRLVGLHRFAVDADPARLAVPLRFRFRRVTLNAFFFALALSSFDDPSVDAIPAYFFAASLRFFPGTETPPASALAFCRRDENNVSVNTAPAVIRRRITA